MGVTVLFDKSNYANGDSAATPAGETTVCTISGSSIVTGHRYFVFATGNTIGGYSNTTWRVRFGGSADGDIDGAYTPQGGAATHKVFTQWTGTNGQDITLTVDKNGANNGTYWNAYLMAIDLDSGGLEENVDWFYSENTTTETPHHSYGSEDEPAELTWTPDGSSDYLVMGSVTIDSTSGNRHESMRMKDITNGVNLFEAGTGGSNGLTEHHVNAGFAVVAAPTATSRLYRTQYRQFGSSSPGKQNANIGILRLNHFQNYSFFNTDQNTAPVDTSEKSAGTIDVAPGADGGLVVMAAAMSQTNGNNFSNYGIAGFVDQDSTQFWGTNQALGPTSTIVHAGNVNYTGDDGARVGAYMFEYIDGLTPDQSSEFELRYFPSNTGSDNTVRQTMLLAFSSQEFVPPPEKASVPDPGDGYIEVFITDDLFWEVNGEGTLTSDIYFGTSESAVTNATQASPEFKGNTASTTYEPGLLSLDTTYYWRIDTVNEGGTTKGDTWSFVTTVFIPLPDKATNPMPPNNDSTLHNIDKVTLSWSGDPEALTHEVYFSEELDDVTNDLLSGSFLGEQVGTSIQVTNLTPRTTYYWRIDTVGLGGRQTGDVWQFETVPFVVTSPRDGDRVYSVIPIEGKGRPGNGIKMEVHTDSGFLTDGYALVNSSGIFKMVIPFENQNVGTDIRLVGVAQSTDSVELTLSLVQGRKPIGEVKTRTGRKLGVDSNTIALWHMGHSVLQKTPQGGPTVGGFGAMPKVLINFWETAPPNQSSFNNPENSRTGNSFSRDGGPSEAWRPRINAEVGVFTYYNFNETSSYSRVQNFNDDDQVPILIDGFNLTLTHRSQRPIPFFAPTANDHTINYIVDGDTTRWRLYGGGTTYRLINIQDNRDYSLSQDLNVFDWNTLQVYGHQFYNTAEPNARYLELYVNDELRSAGWATTTSGHVNYIGNAFTSSNFVAGQIAGYKIEEGDPFIARMGTNLQGDSSRTAEVYRGILPVSVDDQDVPFDSALEFNGSTGRMRSSDAAFEPSAPFTVELWFKTFGDTGASQMLAAKESFNTNGWRMYMSTSLTLFWEVANGSVTTAVGPVIEPNKWYYAAMVYDGTDIIGYINGKEFARATGGFTLNTAQNLVLGMDSDEINFPFNGEMTQFRMSDIARSPWEIYNNYFAVDDPQIGFINDIKTTALINFDEPEGRLYHGEPNPTQLPRVLGFDDADQTRNYFHIDDPFVFFDGDNPNSVDVIGGKLQITLDHASNDFTRAIVETRGKARISGDFDVSIKAFPWDRSAGTPWGANTSRISMRLITATNGVAYLIYDEFATGSGSFNRVWGYLYETTGVDDSTSVITLGTGPSGGTPSIPSQVDMRIARKGSIWYFYYGINGDPPSTLLGVQPGPTEDCYISLDCFIGAADSVAHTAVCSFDDLQIRGFNEGIATIDNQTGLSLVDGETFTIDDGEGNVETFEFDLSNDGVSGGNIEIDIDSGDSGTVVRDAVITAINSSSLNVKAKSHHRIDQKIFLFPNSGPEQKISMSDTVSHPLWFFNGWDPKDALDGYVVKDDHGLYGTLNERPSAIGTTAIDFNGTGSSGIMPDSPDWDHQDLSVEIWFRPDLLHNARLIERKFTPDSFAGFHLDIGSDGYLDAQISDTEGTTVTAHSDGPYSADTWHYVAFTFDKSESTLRLYLDGKLVGENTNNSLNGLYNSDLPVYIGRTRLTNDLFFDGAMGSVRISRVVRSPKEIFEVYNGAKVKEL